MKKIVIVLLFTWAMGLGVVSASEDRHGAGAGHMMGHDGSMPPGHGMMDDRSRMGPGMGRGFMHQGGAACSPMMGGGMMRHGAMPMRQRGHMGQWGMMGGLTGEQYQELMDDTVRQRKKMHMLHFEYVEARRNPKTTLGELGDMEQEMLDLRKGMMKRIDSARNKQ